MSLTAPYTNAMRVRAYNLQYSWHCTNMNRLVKGSIHTLKRFASRMPFGLNKTEKKARMAWSLRLLQRRLPLQLRRTLLRL